MKDGKSGSKERGENFTAEDLINKALSQKETIEALTAFANALGGVRFWVNENGEVVEIYPINQERLRL